MEIEIGQPGSNYGLVCCIHFRANAVWKGMTLSLLPSVRDCRLDWACIIYISRLRSIWLPLVVAVRLEEEKL